MIRLLLIFLILVSAACSPKLNKAPAIKNFVPEDLHKGNKILLVKAILEGKRNIRLFKECMNNHYKGKYEFVPENVSLDKAFPDTGIYKYVLVISGALYEYDFNGISNRAQFFNSAGEFVRTGSSLYIFDRTADHPLYDSNEGARGRLAEKFYATWNGEGSYSFKCWMFKDYIDVLNGSQ